MRNSNKVQLLLLTRLLLLFYYDCSKQKASRPWFNTNVCARFRPSTRHVRTIVTWPYQTWQTLAKVKIGDAFAKCRKQSGNLCAFRDMQKKAHNINALPLLVLTDHCTIHGRFIVFQPKETRFNTLYCCLLVFQSEALRVKRQTTKTCMILVFFMPPKGLMPNSYYFQWLLPTWKLYIPENTHEKQQLLSGNTRKY